MTDREMIERLLDTLATALPYVSDATDDAGFKRGVVARHELLVRDVIAEAIAHLSPARRRACAVEKVSA